MTRTRQTWTLVGAIMLAALFLAWVLWPEPNLDGLNAYEKCSYRSHYKNHGGSESACKKQASDAAVRHLMRGY